MINKAIKIDYYEVYRRRKENNNKYVEEKVDISAIFEILKDATVQERTFKYGGETIRFQKIKYDTENKIWEVQILRSRNIIAPGIADNSGNYTITTLTDDKYYAESISLLYSGEKSLLAFQINHNYMTRTVLEEILNKFQEDLTEKILLFPIIVKDKAQKIKKAKFYTKLHIIAKQNPIETMQSDTLMGSILSSTKKYEGSQVEITIGFGRARKKKDTLNTQQIKEEIEFLSKNENIESLQIDYKSEIDELTDTFNLIKERLQDWIHIQRDSNKKPILHEDVIERMKTKIINKIENGII